MVAVVDVAVHIHHVDRGIDPGITLDQGHADLVGSLFGVVIGRQVVFQNVAVGPDRHVLQNSEVQIDVVPDGVRQSPAIEADGQLVQGGFDGGDPHPQPHRLDPSQRLPW